MRGVTYVVLGAVATAAALGLTGCARTPAAGPGFTLVADSLGDIPMHPDALKLDNLAQAYDRSMATRWTTVTDMEPGFFVELDFARTRKVAALTLDSSPSPNDFPRNFGVETCDAKGNWDEAGAYGENATKNGVTTVTFNPPRAVRKVLLTVSQSAPYWWSIYEIKVKYAD